MCLYLYNSSSVKIHKSDSVLTAMVYLRVDCTTCKHCVSWWSSDTHEYLSWLLTKRLILQIVLYTSVPKGMRWTSLRWQYGYWHNCHHRAVFKNETIHHDRNTRAPTKCETTKFRLMFDPCLTRARPRLFSLVSLTPVLCPRFGRRLGWTRKSCVVQMSGRDSLEEQIKSWVWILLDGIDTSLLIPII